MTASTTPTTTTTTTPATAPTTTTTPTPSRPPGIKLATYNIRDGRNSRLVPLCRTLQHQHIDLCVATETRMHTQIHTKHSQGCDIVCTYTDNPHQGGIALITNTMTQSNWSVESTLRHGPNVLSFELVSGKTRTPMVGVHLAPSHLDDLPAFEEALNRFPDTPPIVLGDLNADLANADNPRTTSIIGVLSSFGLEDLIFHYTQRKRFTHRMTWHQYRQDTKKIHRSRCDCILAPDRRLFECAHLRNPRYFDSDHLMIVARMLAQPTKSHRRYLNGRRRFPIRLPLGPLTRADHLFTMVKQQCPPPPRHTPAIARPSWLLDETIKAIDQRCSLRKDPKHDRAEARRLTRTVNRLMNQDRKRRTEEAGMATQAALNPEDPDPQGAHNHLKKWYRHHGDRPPKPNRQDLLSVTDTFQSPFTKEQPAPPGPPIPIHVQPRPVLDSVPTQDEIRKAVGRLRNNRSTGPTKMKAEDVKQWREEAFPEEHATNEAALPEPQPEKWNRLCSLTQHVFETGEIPTELTWSLLALLPKPCGGTRGVGPQEVVWKLCSAIIDTRLKEQTHFHDVLHGFTIHRGTGTAIIEAKLQQELAHMRGVPLFQVFLDLKKAHDTLDRERSLETLQAYGLGPRCARVLRNARHHQQIVARQSGYHGPAFTATRGSPQGDLLSPQEFNISVDAVTRHWLTLVIDDDGRIQTEGLGLTVAEKLTLFCADDGLLSATDSDWLQLALDTLIGLFRRIGLHTNANKTHMMTCCPGLTPSQLSTPAHKRRMDGHGATFRERQRQKVACPDCGRPCARSYLRRHRQQIHGVDEMDWDTITDDTPLRGHYRVTFHHNQAYHACPVPTCPHHKLKTPPQMRQHFMHRHWDSTLCIANEGSLPLPRCPHCDMHVTHSALNGTHPHSTTCRKGAARKLKRSLADRTRRAREVTMQALGRNLDKVTSFKCLGRILTHTNNDWPTITKNISKARQKWALIARPLVRTGVKPRIVGMFCEAIVQSVLLHACETWVVTPSVLNALRGFHHKIARRIANKMPVRLPNDDWHYPPIEDALRIAGLYPIETHIAVRQNTILKCIVERPIYQLCTASTASAPENDDDTDTLSTSSRLYRWWTQPLIVDPPPPVATDNPDTPPTDPLREPAPAAQAPLNPAAPPFVPAPPPHPEVIDVESDEEITADLSSLTLDTNDVTDAPHPPSVRDLTAIEHDLVTRALSDPGPEGDTLTMIDAVPVTRRSIRTLNLNTWLDDNAINACITLLRHRTQEQALEREQLARSHIFTSFFFTNLLDPRHSEAMLRGNYSFENAQRWSRRVPGGMLFALKDLLIPIHTSDSHWACIWINLQERRISYLDSMGSAGPLHCQHVLRYLRDVHTQLYPTPFGHTDWTIQPQLLVPRQNNMNDCGVFCCMFMDCILQGKLWDFNHTHIPYFRRRIALSLLQGKVLDN